MKRCARCKLEKPLDAFYADKSQVDGKDRRCIDCAKKHLAALKAKRGDEMRARRRARHAERMATDPEYAARQKRDNRERQRRYRKERPEVNRAQVRRRYERIRNDPQKWAAFLAKKREYINRLKTDDPDKYEALLEARRINRRLRRIEAGLPVRDVELARGEGSATKVEAAPLLPLLENWIKRYEVANTSTETSRNVPTLTVLSERSDISIQVIRRIRKGQKLISLDTADKLCYAIDIPFSMVYMEEDAE